MKEKIIFDQLEQIAKNQPVWDGDLINKEATKELLKRKWIMWYCDGEIKNTSGDFDGGYVMTEKGKKIHAASLIIKTSAVKSIDILGIK